mmetsp:Transcript_3823/g.9331  ORF Transcript_3823/g.9331 Transcript_3823/m.9331 type:complete len:105 (-) Transcript_3823:62-376(-)
MPIEDTPTFTVINDNPSFGELVTGFRPSDYGVIAASTTIPTVVGLSFGKPAPRIAGAMLCLIGVTGGFTIALQNSAGRLLGFKENRRECETYSVPFVDCTPGSL